MTAAEELCRRHNVAVYQCGQVYDDMPPDIENKWMVAVIAGTFEAYLIEEIPLAETQAEAYQIAADSLKLWSID